MVAFRGSLQDISRAVAEQSSSAKCMRANVRTTNWPFCRANGGFVISRLSHCSMSDPLYKKAHCALEQSIILR